MKEIDLKQGQKKKGPRTKAPFTSHHPLPPKRSFNDQKLIDDGQRTRYILYFISLRCNGGSP